MEKLIKNYIKKQTPKILHKLRIECRRRLSFLQKESLTNTGYEAILKFSSKLRDTDVMLKICENKKIRKFLKKRRKKLNKRFLKELKNIHFETTKIENPIKTEITNCKEILKDSFLGKSDKELHKLRLKIKVCRYTNKEYEKEFKKLQDALGKAHDLYNCEKLSVKMDANYLNITNKKKKKIFEAEKLREEIYTILP